MNALSQFHRSPFQAYYTVISRSFLLLGIASQAFLAAVPCKGGEEVRLSSLPWFITPPPGLRFALVLRLFVFTVSFLFVLPLCWLVIFIHLMSWRAAHRFVITPNLVVRKGLVAVVMYCTDYCGEAVRLRACVCVCAETRDWKGESSNPACPGQLPSKRREHSRTIVFCQRNKHRICIVNFWLSLPPQKKKIPMNSPMNPNLKLFHGGTTSWLEQILCSKQSGQGKL